MKKVAEGFIILKRYGEFKNACWLLYHNNEGAIVEMPHFKKIEKPPYEKASSFFKRYKIFPKYGFLSHPHWDHAHSLPLFRLEFPRTKFIAHSSFLKDSYIKFLLKNSKTDNKGYGPFDEVFNEICWQGDIGGEPIFLIHAPKHSPTDLMLVFRGAMITGDWYIGDIKDCNNLIDPEEKIRSIENLKKIINKLNYNIHMLFSAHGDCLFYEADFHGIMEETKMAHNGEQVDLPARCLSEGDLPHIFNLKI